MASGNSKGPYSYEAMNDNYKKAMKEQGIANPNRGTHGPRIQGAMDARMQGAPS
jgi:hypothetical protein